MARICEICGKGPLPANTIWRRGKPKRQGGIGQHVTAVTPRRLFPNLQKVRALVGGGVRTINVCTACLKRGKVVKAPHKPKIAKAETVAAN